MTRGRGPILIVVSLLLAGGAAWLSNKWITARAAPAPTLATTHILTAAIDLPLGTKIESRHVATMEMMPGREPPGTFHDLKEVEGKITIASVTAGQMLMAPLFAKDGAGSTLAAVVAKDKRAVTVRVDDVVGVAGFLLPGNRVDVVATSKDEHGNAFTSATVLSNIKVLAVDQTAAANSNDPVVVRAVTLEVTPEEAEILLRGKAAGSIQLALRNPLDEGDARHAPVPVKSAPKVIARAPLLAQEPPITVIRGTKVAHEAGHD
jgi:pilus assembly protein CpaB